MASKAGRHWIANPAAETAAGVAAFVLGWLLLKDAYDDRGRSQPAWMRPFTWW